MHQGIFSRRNFCGRAAATIAILSFLPQTSHALPSASKSDKGVERIASFAIAKEPALKGTTILSDDKTDTIYVSPSSKKVQTGVFRQTQTAGCDILEDHYNLAFHMPNAPVEIYGEIARRGPFSPFFDAHFGNYVRHADILSKLSDKVGKIEQYKEENAEVVEDYLAKKQTMNDAQTEYEAADASLAQLNSRIQSILGSLSMATTEEERAILEAQLEEARETKNLEMYDRKQRVRDAMKELQRIRPLYAEAKAKYEAAIPDIENLKEEIATLMSVLSMINNLSREYVATADLALKQFENETIGVASASYSIWGDEEALLRSALTMYSVDNRYNNSSVRRLPIHNIILKKPFSVSQAGSISGEVAIDSKASISRLGASSDALPVGERSEPSMLANFAKDDSMVRPEIKTLEGDGANTYNNLVTRGSFCTGQSDRAVRSVRLAHEHGQRETTFEFEVADYLPRTKNLLAQSIALEYDYFVRTDPIKVSCSLDINRFRSFVNKSGSAGFLFWRKSWSETERRRVDESGLSCKLDLNPAGDKPDYKEQRDYINGIKQAMMQEIAAEFIQTYAKSYEVKENLVEIKSGKAAAVEAGIALQSLCGVNVYCAVTSIILKTGHELFGAGWGETNSQDHLSGTITRSYEENAFTTVKGQAIVDLTVEL